MKFPSAISFPESRRDKLFWAIIISLFLHLTLPTVLYWGQRHAPLPTPAATKQKQRSTRMRPAQGSLEDMVMFDSSPHLPELPKQPSKNNTDQSSPQTKTQSARATNRSKTPHEHSATTISPAQHTHTAVPQRQGSEPTPKKTPSTQTTENAPRSSTRQLSAQELKQRALANLLKPRSKTKSQSSQKKPLPNRMIPKNINGTGKTFSQPITLGCSMINGRMGKDLAFKEGEAGTPSLEELKWVSYFRSIARELFAGGTKYLRYAHLPLRRQFGIVFVIDTDGNVISYQLSQTSPDSVNNLLTEWVKFVTPLPPVPEHLLSDCTYVLLKMSLEAYEVNQVMMYCNLAHGNQALPI